MNRFSPERPDDPTKVFHLRGRKAASSSSKTSLVLGLMIIAALVDGFDISAIGFVSAELVKNWHIASAQLAPLLSAGVMGLLVGAPVLGAIGDRFGRKRALILGLCIIGGFTLLTTKAASLPQFVVLRFLTGLGLGGLIPNVIALAAEIVPKDRRGLGIVIVSFGVPAGFAVSGLVAAALVPRFGWPALMLVGGAVPLIVAALCQLAMIQTAGDFTGRSGIGFPPFWPRGLFLGGMAAAITPLLWLVLAANQVANFFALSWLPTILALAGLSTAHASLNVAMFSVGGLLAGLILTFLIDRLGVIPMTVLFLLGVPLMAAIGYVGADPPVLTVVMAGAGFCVTGINFNVNGALGMVYPSHVRSLGAGWGLACGRLGSLAAPVIGGALLATGLPLPDLLLAPSAALASGAVASVGLAALCVRRFAGYELDDTAATVGRDPTGSSTTVNGPQ